MDKNELRKIARNKRNSLSSDEIFRLSNIITTKLYNHPWFIEAKTIGFYASLPKEVDTILLLEQALQKKRIALPKVDGDEMKFYRIKALKDLKEGSFNVYEPTTPYLTRPNKMDLIIVPMLSFNSNKYRIGYGKGYYDKYLKEYKGHTIGLCFDMLKSEEDFEDDYDVALDVIITDEKIY